MTTFSRRTLLSVTGAAGVAAVLAACSDTGADGKSVSESSASSSASGGAESYDTIINSGPVASDDEVSASTWASAVKKAGTFKIGGTKTNQVFSLEDPTTGKVTGFDAAISQLLARYILGGDDASSLVEITQATSDTRETLLENGSVEAVFATYTITPERAEKITFAGPYYESGQTVLVKADNDKITGVTSLTSGVKVAVQANSTSVQAVTEHAPDAEQVQFETDSDCVAAVEAGQVDAYVLDEAVLLATVASNDNVKLVGEPFTTEPYGIGLPKDSDGQAFVNAFLAKIDEDGTWTKVWENTIGSITQGTAPEPPVIGSVEGAATASATPTA